MGRVVPKSSKEAVRDREQEAWSTGRSGWLVRPPRRRVVRIDRDERHTRVIHPHGERLPEAAEGRQDRRGEIQILVHRLPDSEQAHGAEKPCEQSELQLLEPFSARCIRDREAHLIAAVLHSVPPCRGVQSNGPGKQLKPSASYPTKLPS